MKRLFLITVIALCPVFANASGESEKLRAIEEMIDKNGIDNVMQQFIAYEHNQLPIKKDRMDTITSVMYVKSTRAKIYKHILTPKWEQIISDITKISVQDAKQYMPELMQKQSINSICSNKLNQVYFKHGVKILNVYSKSDGTKIFTTTVTKSDCGT